jgi:4-hydroxy-4-methyl-2-oxoglutarate aldolase
MEWRNDSELFQLVRSTLYTPVIGDILDGLGFYHQFLPPAVQPIRDDMVVTGRAMPVLLESVTGPQPDAFLQLTRALDQIEAGEVYITTEALNCASWGEIMTATARMRGGVGAVINGFHRDTPQVLEQNWPVFSRGRYAQDSGVRSAVVDYRCPIYIGEVRVDPGDLIFGDLDGVLIVPQSVEAEAIGKALEKARGEKLVRAEIEGGASSASVFEKYGIL